MKEIIIILALILALTLLLIKVILAGKKIREYETKIQEQNAEIHKLNLRAERAIDYALKLELEHIKRT